MIAIFIQILKVAVGVVPLVMGVSLCLFRREMIVQTLGHLGVDEAGTLNVFVLVTRITGVILIVLGAALTAFLIVLPLIQRLS